jgi:hypothetical protein
MMGCPPTIGPTTFAQVVGQAHVGAIVHFGWGCRTDEISYLDAWFIEGNYCWDGGRVMDKSPPTALWGRFVAAALRTGQTG